MKDKKLPPRGFFSLPPEIRDEIYDLCLEARSFSLDSENKTELVNVRNVSVQPVSRQFRRESLKREKEFAALNLTLTGTSKEHKTCRLPFSAKRMTRVIADVHVDVVINDSGHLDTSGKSWRRCVQCQNPSHMTANWFSLSKTLRAHRQRISDTTSELLLLKSLDVRIYLQVSEADCPPEEFGLMLEEVGWLTARKLTSLEVVYRGEESEEPQTKLVWSKETRQLGNV